MTVKEFAKLYSVKQRTVEKWLNNGFIQGAKMDESTNEWIIPEHARLPYTEARAKTADAIYISILKACVKRKGICPALYKISEAEFNGYIKELVDAHLICERNEDGVTYYDAALKSREYLSQNDAPLNKLIKELITMTVESSAKGITAAVLEKAS